MYKSEEILGYLEKKLDFEHLLSVKEILKKALNYEKLERIPLSFDFFPNLRFIDYPYIEAYEDFDKMMVNELINVCNSADLKDDSLPMIRANYGVGILPSLFGCRCRIVNGNLPWVDAYNSTDKIKQIIEKGIPDINYGLGAKVFAAIQYYKEKLLLFPKCQQLIRIYHPDLQGPFDVAHLIWGPEIYYALYDEAELVHDFLRLITKTYIHFMKELKKEINDEDVDYCFHWGTLFRGRILIRNDSSVNISKEMYEEFVKPYDEEILKEFGMGSIHFCGRGDQWLESMLETNGMKTINFGQPPNLSFGFDFLNKYHEKMRENEVSIARYLIDKESISQLTKSKFTTGVTFCTTVLNRNDGEEILKLSRDTLTL